MFVYIYSIFLVIWEVLCCKFLIESFFSRKKYKYNIISYVILSCTFFSCYLMAYLFYDNMLLKQIVIIIVMSTGMYFLFEKFYLNIFVLTALYEGLVLIADYLTLLILGKIFPSLSTELQNANVSMVVSFIGKVSLLCIVLILKRKIGYKRGDILTVKEWSRLLIIPVITIASLIAIMREYDMPQKVDQKDALLYVALGMVMMNIIVFFLISDVLDRETIIRNEKLLWEKAKNETAMYYSIHENLDKHRKRTHEFKNHLTCIAALAENNNYSELQNYVSKLNEELRLYTNIVDTNNVIVNAILNTKYKEALDKGILMVLKVNDLSKIRLSDTDVVIIMSNLLNNAIEACDGCNKKIIKMKFTLEDDQVIILVKNSISKNPIHKNNEFLTGKDDPDEHGIGIYNVKEVVERYEGTYVIEYENDIFSFSILIPNK